MSTEQQVEHDLSESSDRYLPGQAEYYACLALEQALAAHREGNYGIGAIAVVVRDTTVSEFSARNALFSEAGVIDHAETRALIAVRSGRKPDKVYLRTDNQWTERLPLGISVYGTLEPCPMCACVMTNAGVRHSVSIVLDGELVHYADIPCSNGGATVIGQKAKLQPKVWQWLQSQLGLEFTLLETEDVQLKELSKKIFEDYREQVDERLARRHLL